MATIATALPRPRRIRKIIATRVGARAPLPDVYYLKRIDNSGLRREVDRGTRRECYCLLGLGIMVFLFLLVFAWQSFAFVRDGHKVESARAQRESLTEWNRQLRLEHAALADPQRIDALARKSLGLALPQPHQVIRLDGAGSAGDAGPAQIAQNRSVSGVTP